MCSAGGGGGGEGSDWDQRLDVTCTLITCPTAIPYHIMYVLVDLVWYQALVLFFVLTNKPLMGDVSDDTVFYRLSISSVTANGTYLLCPGNRSSWHKRSQASTINHQQFSIRGNSISALGFHNIVAIHLSFCFERDIHHSAIICRFYFIPISEQPLQSSVRSVTANFAAGFIHHTVQISKLSGCNCVRYHRNVPTS